MPRQETSASAVNVILDLMPQAASRKGFLEKALAALAEPLSASVLAVRRAERGEWRTLASLGDARQADAAPGGEALDRDDVAIDDGWFAAPLGLPNEVFVGRVKGPAGPDFVDRAAAIGRGLGRALAVLDDRQREKRRVARLEAILEIAAQWNRTLEMDKLLNQMAETSTRLLDAERASIFLWDKNTKTLVGRPALGVENGELRIPDDTGVVGRCVQTGQSRRVDSDDQHEINRAVDKQLDFHTRSLLCVPLRGSGGELFGAFELINKRGGNFTDDDEAALVELAAHAAVALENTREHEQLVKVRDQFADAAIQGAQLIGNCAAIDALRSTIGRVADTDLALLLLGENGTGKEVVAKRVHYLSRRRNEPFVAVNCAALTETLLESELFGHEKGAFTDAHATHIGKFELASGGTLFLDEIGDMSLSGQAKLLRVLEEKVVVRVGGSVPIHTDARVIAATNQDLGALVRGKKFREDLFFRLNVVTVELPPLRERGEDVLQLADHFLREFCLKARRKPPKLTAAARRRLVGHAWPGNVRELRNLMERIAYLSQGDKIDTDELAFIISPADQDTSLLALDTTLADATRRFQGEYIKKHIERARGNMTDAANRLGLHRSNLYRKMRQLDMDTADA